MKIIGLISAGIPNFMPVRFFYRSLSAFSLIEMILYVAIASTVVAGLGGFWQLVAVTRERQRTSIEVETQGIFAMARITETLRMAQGITAPTPGTTSTTLIVITETASTSPTTFSLSGGQLRVSEGSGAATPLTTNAVVVSNLLFTNAAVGTTSGSIRTVFTLNRTSSAASFPYVASSTFVGGASLR